MRGSPRLLAPVLATLGALALPVHGGAQAPERGRASLFRQLGAPDAQRALTLGTQAALLLSEADNGMSADWETICRSTLALRVGSDSVASLRGKARALEELARDALRAQARVQGAIARLQRARRLAPEDPKLVHALAHALARWQELGPPWECSVKRRDDEAIELLELLETKHPSFAPEDVAFELGVLLTRASRFSEAASAYARADALAIESDGGMARANLAETQMLSGDLEGAVASYNRALDKAQQGHGHALAVWGLALALERSGDHARAVERLQRAFGMSDEGLSVLRSEGVFFVPAYEVYAYEALGHEARAQLLTDATEQSAELRAAAVSLRSFLSGAAHAARVGASNTSSAGASYQAAAEDGLRRVLSELERLGKRQRKQAKRQ